MAFEIIADRHKTTGICPFEVDTGIIPLRPVTRELEEATDGCNKFLKDQERRESIRRTKRDNIAAARISQKYYADRSRRDVQFCEGIDSTTCRKRQRFLNASFSS